MSAQLPRPVAVCTVCKTFSRNASLINYICGDIIDGKRCKGMWQGALHVENWEECQTCQATSNTCEQCNGEGWIYLKK